MAIKPGQLKIAIDRIAKKTGGRITPQIVVDTVRAAGPKHVLYKEFDWDIESAAYKHWCAQAQALIRRIEYVGVDVKGREVVATGYVYERETKAHVPLMAVAADRERSKMLLQQEMAQCESHIRRAQNIADVLKMRDEFDDLLGECIRVRDEVEQKTSKRKQMPPPKGRSGKGPEKRPN